MASEYLKWKARNEKKEVPKPMTPREKRKNWWDYHKWYVVLGLVLLLILLDIGWNALGKAKPDYQIAYVGTNALPEDTVAALEQGFASFGQDLNGDGKVLVTLHQFVTTGGSDGEFAYAAETTLLADLESCDSFLFLLEQPVAFQQRYHVLCKPDGTLPQEGDRSGEGTYFLWEQCPRLAGMALGDYRDSTLGQEVTGSSQDRMKGLAIARRGFWTEKTVANLEGCEAFWEEIMEGAVQ